MRLNPNSYTGYGNLGRAFRRLNRFEEAKEVFERALEQKLDATAIRFELYKIAVVQGDTAAMKQQIDSMSGKPDEYVAQVWQAGAAVFSGQSRKAQGFSSRAIDLTERRNLKEAAAAYAAADALKGAVFGTCQQAKEETAKAFAIARTRDSLRNEALALALCGEANKAQSLIDELSQRYPKDTLLNAVWLPSVRAAIEIHHSNPGQAVELLKAAGPYEMGLEAILWPVYIRGLAYLRQRAAAEAAAEFQKILDHKGAVLPTTPLSVSSFSLYPLAHLGLARAAAMMGDTAKSRKAYEDFFALWKDADPDLPILIEAKKEYQNLR
jgi:tetratricopeptide (TPR) repeat protein